MGQSTISFRGKKHDATTSILRRTQAPIVGSALSPLFAVVLSAVMPGLGQLYNREEAKAAAILCSTFGIWAGLVWTTVGPDASRSWFSAVALLLAYPFVLLPAVLDAHRSASGIREASCSRASRWHVVIMILVIGPLLPVDLSLAGSILFVQGTGWQGRGVEWTPTSTSWKLRTTALCANLANPYLSVRARALGSVGKVFVESNCPFVFGYHSIGGGTLRNFSSSSERIFLQEIVAATLAAPSRGRYDSLTNIFFLGFTNSICVVPYVFGDGLESGDTSAWSSAVA